MIHPCLTHAKMNVIARAILKNPVRRNVLLYQAQAVRHCGGCCRPCCCIRGGPIVNLDTITVPPSKKPIILDILSYVNAAEGDKIDLDKIVEDASATEISLKWKHDDMTPLSGNTVVYRLLGKLKNKLLYPENAMEAAEVDQAIEMADRLAKGGNSKDPIFTNILKVKEPFDCQETDEVRTITPMDFTIANIVVKHEVEALVSIV